MVNNEVETLLNEEENQVEVQQEQSADFLDENANMYSDSYRKSVFDGGTPIYPYGKNNQPIYLNDPNVDPAFHEDLFQKHLELNAPKEKVDPFEGMNLDEIQQQVVSQKKEEQLESIAIFGEPEYVNEYNTNQAQVLRKHKLSPDVQKILIEGNFALPFKRNTGYVEDADKTVGLLSMVDGLWDNYIAFPPNLLKDVNAKQSQLKLNEIQAAIEGRWDDIPRISMMGNLKNKTLEELDLLRGEEQTKLEIFLEGKIPTSTEWWQNRIRKNLGVEVPIEVLEDLKKDAGGFATQTTGYIVDFAPIAAGFSTAVYRNALKKYKGFTEWSRQFKKSKDFKKGMTDDDIFNEYIKQNYPATDTANKLKSNWFSRFWGSSQIKTGMQIRESKEFMRMANKLEKDIFNAQKVYDDGLIKFNAGKIDKQQLITLSDNVRDLKFKQLSYQLKGIPQIFKQDAAMELGFASGAVLTSRVFGDQFELLGGAGGGLSIGMGGNWLLGIGRTGYHGLASFFDIATVAMRNGSLGFEGDVMRLKPQILRETKIWDKKLNAYREINWAEFAQFEKFAMKLNEGGPDVMRHLKANIENYEQMVSNFEKVLGSENIHLFHEEFAIISMLGPMMAARDAAKVGNSGVATLFSKDNPDFLNNLATHQFLIKSLQDTLDEISNKSVRGVPGEEGALAQTQIKEMQDSLQNFINQNQLETTQEFAKLLDDSKQFFDNIGQPDHPMWSNSEILYENLARMDEFFDFMKKDPILNEMINKPQYESLINDVQRYKSLSDSISSQITKVINNSSESSVPLNFNLAKGLLVFEREAFTNAMGQYNKVYKKYGNANIDGFNLFESFWKAFGDKDNLISGKKVFWRGNEKAPRQFKQIKGIFDGAAERQIRKLHILDKGEAYIDGLTSNLKELEYKKWFKEKQFALAEQLNVKPNTIDHMTMFEWLRKSVGGDEAAFPLTFNIQELSKLRGEFQRIDFVLSKQKDTSAGVFASLFDDSEKLIDDLAEKYKEAYPNLKDDLLNARENFKYNYANRYLDKESDIAEIGSKWLTYSQLGQEFPYGPYFPRGKTLKNHPTTWINYNEIKKNPELFKDKISLNVGTYVKGKGYLIDPTSNKALMWKAHITRMIDEQLGAEFRKNIGKFTTGKYRILDGEIVDTDGHSINLFHDIIKLADKLSVDSIDGTKFALYEIDNLINNKKAIITELGKNTKLNSEIVKLQSDLVRKANTDGAIIRKLNQQAEQKILNQVGKISDGLSDNKTFIERFIGKEGDVKTGLDLITLRETMLKQGTFKNKGEFNMAVSNMIGDYITMSFSNQNVGGKWVHKGISKNLNGFDFDGFKGWLDSVEPSLKQIMDDDHFNYLRSTVDMSAMIQKDILKIIDKGGQMVFPAGLGLPAILSRIYGLARGVIGFRFVASELTLRAMNKGKGDFIKEMLKSKDAARVVNEIIDKGVIDKKLNMDFSRALEAAYIETAIIEPESEKMDIPSFFGLGIPYVDTEKIIKAPAEFIEGITPDMSKQEQYTTMFPEGSQQFPVEEHKGAYERPTPEQQMEKLGFVY